MNIIGVFMEGPNTGACLVKDGKMIAVAEEERFLRIKKASDYFPAQAIKYCLREGNTKLKDVSIVALGWDHSKYPRRMDEHMGAVPERELDKYADTAETIVHTSMDADWAHFKVINGLKKIDPQAKPDIRYYSHHKCHAASVHYLSGFDKSSILSLDGSGEEISTSAWIGEDDEIKLLRQWDLPNSLGWYYASLTEFLGFSAYSGEGKVMGLAPYGKPDEVIAEKLRRIVHLTEDGYQLDPTYIYYGERNYNRRFTDKLVKLLGMPRPAEAKLTPYYESVAFEAQDLLEEISIKLAKDLISQTGCGKLCITGGVAMNCKMNGVISLLPEVEDVFINPASHDAGTCIGAALLACKDEGISPRQNKLEHAYWGPGFSNSQIEDALNACKLEYEYTDNPGRTAAQYLNEGNIVGWFQGRMEFGSRALGNRSILANPTIPNMKEEINRQVKFREPFRPFAPSLTEESLSRYSKNSRKSPFMILAYEVNDGIAEALPSVVHVDGSIRPQTVNKTVNEPYWNLLDEFGKLSGHPLVLNTSFNIRGEPIVCTPNEAIRCFYATGLDVLCLGNYVLKK